MRILLTVLRTISGKGSGFYLQLNLKGLSDPNANHPFLGYPVYIQKILCSPSRQSGNKYHDLDLPNSTITNKLLRCSVCSDTKQRKLRRLQNQNFMMIKKRNQTKWGWCLRTGKGQRLMMEAINEYIWLDTCQGRIYKK